MENHFLDTITEILNRYGFGGGSSRHTQNNGSRARAGSDLCRCGCHEWPSSSVQDRPNPPVQDHPNPSVQDSPSLSFQDSPGPSVQDFDDERPSALGESSSRPGQHQQHQQQRQERRVPDRGVESSSKDERHQQRKQNRKSTTGRPVKSVVGGPKVTFGPTTILTDHKRRNLKEPPRQTPEPTFEWSPSRVPQQTAAPAQDGGAPRRNSPFGGQRDGSSSTNQNQHKGRCGKTTQPTFTANINFTGTVTVILPLGMIESIMAAFELQKREESSKESDEESPEESDEESSGESYEESDEEPDEESDEESIKKSSENLCSWMSDSSLSAFEPEPCECDECIPSKRD